jgi:uncharacterized protein
MAVAPVGGPLSGSSSEGRTIHAGAGNHDDVGRPVAERRDRLAANGRQAQDGAMSIDGQSDATIRGILTGTRRIAVVSASDKRWRPSHGVFGFLLACGYRVTPVNPLVAGGSIHGRAVVPSLAEATPLEMVDIFRASARAGAVVDEAIRLGARVVWMQLGVVDQAAARRAQTAGITVVMDRCPVIEARRLNLTPIDLTRH